MSKIIAEHMERAKEANPHCFQFGEDVLKIFDEIEAAVAKEKLLTVNKIVEMFVLDIDDVRNASGILKFLHSQVSVLF